MDRKNFLKDVCSFGICGCVAASGISKLHANSQPVKDIKEETDWRIGFMQKRMSVLVEKMNSKMDAIAKRELLELLGRECSIDGMKDITTKFKGNIDGFLEYAKSRWMENVDYDKENGEIRIKDKKQDSCICPFVDKSLMSGDFCDCSLGWQKQTYEAILGQKVDVAINTSILRGGDCCSFIIKIL